MMNSQEIHSTVTTGHIENGQAAKYNFSISAVMEEAWNKVAGFKATAWKSIGLYLLVSIPLFILFACISKGSSYLLGPGMLDDFISASLSIVRSLILFPLSVGLFMMGIKRAADQPIQAMMVFDYYKDIMRIAGIYIVMGLIIFISVFIGTFLTSMASAPTMPTVISVIMFIIGIAAFLFTVYIIWGYMFAAVLAVEKNFGIWQSLEASRKAVSQHWFKIFFLTIFVLIIISVSAIPLFLGLIWVLPWAYNVRGVLYRTIFGVERK
jgi:hypothetical protein